MQNRLRHGIYGDVDILNQDEMQGIEHLDHCIDLLRQSLMVCRPPRDPFPSFPCCTNFPLVQRGRSTVDFRQRGKGRCREGRRRGFTQLPQLCRRAEMGLGQAAPRAAGYDYNCGQ